nr:putative disease resistance protein [Quercus suber]
MALAFVSSIVDQLGSLVASEFKDRLGSLLPSEVASIVNVKEEVEKLERKFHEIQAKLNDAEERQVKEEAFVLTSGNEEVVRPPTDSHVDVSNILGRDKVKCDLVNSLLGRGGDSNTTDWPSLMDEMCEWVRGRKLFLVLDDVWTEDSTLWEPFRLALQDAAQGSRILVTTRNNRVAKVMGSSKMINLEELSDDDCWSIFSTIAFSDRDSEQRGKDDSQRCELGELKYLNHLQGTLTINRLGNVVDACEAKNAELKKKIGLRDLYLHFFGENVENHGRRMENDVSVLNALEPPPGLEQLQIVGYRGTTMFPNWMMSLAKLKSLTLTRGENLERSPPLGKLQLLEHLIIVQRDGQEVIRPDDEEEFVLGLIKCCRSLIQSQFEVFRYMEECEVQARRRNYKYIGFVRFRLYTLLMLNSKLWSMWVTAFCLRGKWSCK